MSTYPFLFGSQYYRAPTPEPECWEQDLTQMRALGFTDVKYFVQWRWSHRGPDEYYFDDLDRLMDLAHANGLGVTLNTLLDMSPLWLFERHPDAKQVSASGTVIEPYTVSHRSIGGHPGPCYNHPGALEDRKRFMAATVEHFHGHPALAMWDVWNEPEQSFQARTPDFATLTCYCPHCREGFRRWLNGKYGDLDRLNAVWGRCYRTWEQVELPVTGGGLTDFVDWREFHLDTMTQEARWRLNLVREHDPNHPTYLHVVPNVMTCFSSITGVDDFALAEHCDLFAASTNTNPVSTVQVTSAGAGRVCYNVESHVNFGSITMHQRMLDLEALRADWLPQLGLGIRGFMFWQFRPELLGAEAPAWGVVALDGSERPVTRAVREFGERVGPHFAPLMQAHLLAPGVGVWKSRKNECFHFAAHGGLGSLIDSVEGHMNALYWSNVGFRVVTDDLLAAGEMTGLKVLVMPSCYYLTEPEAAALDAWVQRGGTVICEAHLGGYNGTTGRHSRRLPGCGLADAWGIQELDSTSSYHLKLGEAGGFAGSLSDDVKKALGEAGTAGGRFYPVSLPGGGYVWGANRYAVLGAEGATVEGSFNGESACVISKSRGAGKVIYCGTNLGEGAVRDPAPLRALLGKWLREAGVTPALEAGPEEEGTVHVDALYGPGGLRHLVVISRAAGAQRVKLEGEGNWRGVFDGANWSLPGEVTVPGGWAELLVRE